MQEQDMTLLDGVACPAHTRGGFGVGAFCECNVPTSETCPEPSPASVGAFLSKAISFGLAGMIGYALSELSPKVDVFVLY